MRPEHPPHAAPQLLNRFEYAERARHLYQLTPAPLSVNALYLVLCVINMLIIYEDIGPSAVATRVGLLALLNGVALGVAFLVTQEIVRRRAGRLGLLCPSCGHYPMGLNRFRYTPKAQVERILERGRCDLCGSGLFHAAD